MLSPKTPASRTLRGLRTALTLVSLVAPAGAQKAPPPPAPDGPVQIIYKQVFKEGKTTFDGLPLAEAPPLPDGFKALGGTAYRLRTEAVAVGPHVLEFSVASVRDRESFDRLQVLCADWDWIDQKLFWTNCTIRDGEHAPDFEGRRIRASVENQAVYVVGGPDGPPKPPPPVGRAEVSVEIVAPEGRHVANRDLDYQFRVTNRGPDGAPRLELHGSGFSSNEFISATPPERNGGRCRQNGSNFACRLDLLEKNSTAVFHVRLRPYESPRARPRPAEPGREPGPESRPFPVHGFAYAQALDENTEDNNARVAVDVHRDPNLAPEVKFVAPAAGQIFDGGARVRLVAEARDEDGSLARVEFYDGQTLLGAGAQAEGGRFVLDWPNPQPGVHFLSVVATDDGGRGDYETQRAVVNGPLRVRVTAPRPDTVFKTKLKPKAGGEFEHEPVSLTATARVGGGKVKEVFFLLGEPGPIPAGWKPDAATPAGTDPATGETLYTYTFKGIHPASYTLTAFASDERGVMSYSEPVRVRYSRAPPVRIRAEQRPPEEESAVVLLRAEFVIHRHRENPSIKGSRVAFYAGGKLLGSVSADGFGGVIEPFLWLNPPPGTHTVTAVHTNGDGAESDPSNVLTVTVGKK